MAQNCARPASASPTPLTFIFDLGYNVFVLDGTGGSSEILFSIAPPSVDPEAPAVAVPVAAAMPVAVVELELALVVPVAPSRFR